MHPLIGNLSSLSDDELHKKHGELMQRLNFSFNRNSYLTQQLMMILEDYRAEIQRRNQKQLEEMQKLIDARKQLKK